MGIEAAIIGSAVFGAVSSAKGSKDAAKSQVAGQDAALDENQRQYDQTRADYEPYRQFGQESIDRLSSVQGGDMSQFQTSPGYNFRKEEGMQGLDNRFSAGGGGGNAMRALAEHNSNFASNEFGNWYNRQLAGAGAGQNATQGTAQAGDSSSGRMQNNMMSAGNARASGIQGAYQGVNNAFQGGMGNMLYMQGRQKTPVITESPYG
jgi:hypothetical protein